MTCEYLTPQKDYNLCALKMYGGKPSPGTCELCIERGENNEAFVKVLLERASLAHPAGVARISGCCDRADQD